MAAKGMHPALAIQYLAVRALKCSTMRHSISQRLAGLANEQPADNGMATTTRPVGLATAHNEVPERPSAAYLCHLIITLVADKTTPSRIQAECITLMGAINSNDLPKITELVARLARLADAEGFTLPRLDREPSQEE